MESIYHRLKEYANTDYYAFHMPGHKRNRSIFEQSDMFELDITEIDGFDNLHNPKGILKEAMELAAGFYGSEKTYFLINGSTCGILSAISAAVKQNGKLLMARNCHKSCYNGVILRNIKTEYVYPQIIDEFGINGGINPEDVEKALKGDPDIDAVLITSPTYEGIVSDIRTIAKIAHGYGVPLIVDEAHGAHFGMHDELPESALQEGADIVIQSLHKTLPSLTQTAVLHVKSNLINKGEVERFLAIYQSSSPSYLLIGSIDQCIRLLMEHKNQYFQSYMNSLRNLRRRLKMLKKIQLLERDRIKDSCVFSYDPSKIVLSVNKTGISGKELYDCLRIKYHLQPEMASGNYVVLITSIFDNDAAMERLYQALQEMDEELEYIGENDKAMGLCEPIISMQSYEALTANTESIPLLEAENRITAEFVYLYPPGIPFLVPGEKIQLDMIKIIQNNHKLGLEVLGLKDETLQNIRVIEQEKR